MPSMSDHEEDRPTLTRRDLMKASLPVIVGVGAVSGCGAAIPSSAVVVGPPDSVEMGAQRLEGYDVFVVRSEEGVAAISGRCPHAGCGGRSSDGRTGLLLRLSREHLRSRRHGDAGSRDPEPDVVLRPHRRRKRRRRPDRRSLAGDLQRALTHRSHRGRLFPAHRVHSKPVCEAERDLRCGNDALTGDEVET